jgi:4-amino-4-deoxy-L-arabinose transferase-like glycosyltransferase
MAGVGALYFGSVGSWGFWEPWETEYARMGRALATGEGASWLFPEGPGGDVVNKPWLTALMLQVGYSFGGGDEFGLRAPFALLGLITVVACYGFLRRFVAPHRAGIVAVVLATSPTFMLSGINLAGAMPVMATTSLALGCFAMALCAGGSRFWLLLAGLLTGLSLWGGGVSGPIIVLGSVGAIGLYEVFKTPGRLKSPVAIVSMALVAAATFGVAMYFIITAGSAAAALLSADEEGGGLWWILSEGFRLEKTTIGIAFPMGLVLLAVTAGCFSDAFKKHRFVGLLLAVLGIAAVAGPPILLMLVEMQPGEVTEFLLYNSFLSRRTLADHVTFDNLIRQVGFAAYPYTMFLPFAMAYAAQTMGRERGDHAAAGSSDASSKATQSLKGLMMAWLMIGFLLVGLTSTLSRHYIFSALFPIAVLIGLMLTDRGYWEGLRKNRSVLYLIGFACLVILWVLTKDLKTTANAEMGQLGPEVLFEFLLVDGREEFPADYELTSIKTFRYAWGGLVAVYFWMLFSWMIDLPARLRGYSERFKADHLHGYLWRMPLGAITIAAVIALVASAASSIGFGPNPTLLVVTGVLAGLFAVGLLGLGFGYRFQRAARCKDGGARMPESRRAQFEQNFRAFGVGLAEVIFWPSKAGAFLSRFGKSVLEPPMRFAGIFILSVVVFAGVSAAAYIPLLSQNLSPRGLVDSYRTLAREGETFYRVGSARASGNYYLGGEEVEIASGAVNPIDVIRGVTSLRDYYCDSSERMWAMIDRDSLAQAYYEVRRERDDEDEACDPDRDLWVLDARSSRYLLISNQLNAERTDVVEENVNPLAPHIFTELPEDAIAMTTRYTFDDRLLVLGYQVRNLDGEPISSAANGVHVYLDTYFEVLERVPSRREMFIHVDYRNARINGDHDPVGGAFPINYWVEGEIVRDRYELTIERGSATGDYTINIGFFSGDTRMVVSPATGDNRVALGTIRVTGGL